MEKDERLDYAVLISLYTREEAEVMASALRADGIDAFIGNTNHSGVNWFYLIALGGLQVMVPRLRIADAKAAVRERLRDGADNFPEEKIERRGRWKAWVTLGLMVGPAVIIGIHDTLFFGVDWLDALTWVVAAAAYSR
jgi:hypothetical protein